MKFANTVSGALVGALIAISPASAQAPVQGVCTVLGKDGKVVDRRNCGMSMSEGVSTYIWPSGTRTIVEQKGALLTLNDQPASRSTASKGEACVLNTQTGNTFCFRKSSAAAAQATAPKASTTAKPVVSPAPPAAPTAKTEPAKGATAADLGTEHPGLWPLCKAEGPKKQSCGYIDKSGNFVIPPKYENAGDFREGLAFVRLNGKEGVINGKGSFVIPPIHASISYFQEGIAYITFGKRCAYIDRTGKRITSMTFPKYCHNFQDGMVPIAGADGRSGFLRSDGVVAISPRYGDVVGQFKDGFAGVSIRQNLSVLIDKKGNEVPGTRLDDVNSPSEGLAAAKKGGKWGFIDTTGKWIIEPKFDQVEEFSDGLSVAEVNGKSGYIDKTGKFVIEPKYYYASKFAGGIAGVVGERRAISGNLIDKTGRVLTKTSYRSVDFIREGFARVLGASADGVERAGIINRNGEVIVPLLFSSAEPFVHGLAKVEFGEGKGYVDTKGTFLGFTEADRKNGMDAFDARMRANQKQYDNKPPSPPPPTRQVAKDADGNEVETFGGCTFVFLRDNPNREFEFSFAFLSLSGAPKPRESVLAQICEGKPGGRFTLLDGTKEEGDANATMLKRAGNNKYEALFEVDGCRFEYEFGIDGDNFYRRNHYRKNCVKEPIASSSGASGGSGQQTAVGVQLEVVCGFMGAGCAADRKLTLSGGPGRVQSSGVDSQLNIYPGFDNKLAGTYEFRATWDKGRKGCSGKINISGTKRMYHLNLHTTCSDGGSKEY